MIQGNALTELQKLESESVDCCITSPPYYALRDYSKCDCTAGRFGVNDRNYGITDKRMPQSNPNCPKCNGTGNNKNIQQIQIGLEKTFQEYLDKLVEIFTEVKRVLKKSGTCWVVMGDTYAGNMGFTEQYKQKDQWHPETPLIRGSLNVPQKSLLMIPSRFAIQMIDAGWILRNDIIWYKPNCMPSSAKDRFTVDYEHIFFFTKDKKYYFKTQYDQVLYKNRWGGETKKGMTTKGDQFAIKNRERDCWPLGDKRIKRTVWKLNTKPFPEAHFAVFPEELVKQCMDAGCPPNNGTVIDPFSGAGTTYKVALETDRKAIGIELNPQYIEITKKRISPLLLQTKLTSLTK